MNTLIKSINDEFFPTPKSLLDEIESDFCEMWKDLSGELSILEPSAGKGDIVDWLQTRPDMYYLRDPKPLPSYKADIDCIEIEPDLRAILKGKRGVSVVHDDFLTFQTAKRYDLIIMNPPFSNADRHLLKAISLQERYGGLVLCILNAETIRNPFSKTRKMLAAQLEKYHATIRFYDSAFSDPDSERKTCADIAVVGIKIPIPEHFSKSFVFDRLEKAENISYETASEAEDKEIVREGFDYLDSYIKQFHEETEAGIVLIKEYNAYTSVRKARFVSLDSQNEPEILTLGLKGKSMDRDGLNRYVEEVRLRYWKLLFGNPKFAGKLTNKMQSELMSSIFEMRRYDFTMHNILELLAQIRDNTLNGIEASLMELFETFSSKYSYLGETSANIHYYNGWTTNKAHKVNKKVIIPLYNVWSSYRFGDKVHWSLSSYDAWHVLQDLAKALDYIASSAYSSIDTHQDMRAQIDWNFRKGVSSNIETKYFILTFYKKGTCHIVFKDDDLLEKFNLYIGKQKAWLPPDYGRKPYQDLDEKERAVADSFSGGEKDYNRIYENQVIYLVDETQMLMLAESVSA